MENSSVLCNGTNGPENVPYHRHVTHVVVPRAMVWNRTAQNTYNNPDISICVNVGG